MNETSGRNGEKGGIRSLSELPRDIAPPRDLWPSIAAQLGSTGAESAPVAGKSSRRPTGLQWAALAAVVAALAVGMWVGRSVLPGAERSAPRVADVSGNAPPAAVPGNVPPATAPGNAAPATTPSTSPSGTTPAVAMDASQGTQLFASTYVVDPRYVMHRQAMVRDLDAKLNALPEESRQKVAASLAAIHDSMKNIEAELGRDPANALLQELLVNTYQDEMRVLTAVNEASGADREL